MIDWDEKYSTGHPEIDRQHKWLFEFVNALEIQLRSHDQKPDVQHVLNSMKEYAERHFHYEEGCMVKCKCPMADKNKQAHQQFIEAYENFMERFNRLGHSESLAWKIHRMFERWIINHICQIDIALKDCPTPQD